MTTSSLHASSHPPLARDAQGNLVSIPDGTASWRICRKTTGRPREIVGHDKQPIRFPLDMTCDQLVEMCGRDVYRVYALDAVGELLDHVTTLDLNGEQLEPRNSSGTELAVVGRPAAVSTDLRFALEAMTQMMRTNAEALRTVTEAHVDLSKSMAAAKGLRNAALFMPREPEPAPEDEEEYDEPPREKTWVDLALPFAEQLATVVPALAAGRLGASGVEPSNDEQPPAEPLTDEEAALVDRPNWELRDLTDLAYAKRKADAKRKHAAAKATPSGDAWKARVMRDPQVMQKVFAIKAQLTDDELAVLLDAIGKAPEGEQIALLDQLKVMTADEAVAICRQMIQTLRTADAHTEGK